MNCKPGDIALVVYSTAGNRDKILTVERAATVEDYREFGVWPWIDGIWVVDTPCRWVDSAGRERFAPLMADIALRPLRPGNGEDEMLQLVGKPEGVAV